MCDKAPRAGSGTNQLGSAGAELAPHWTLLSRGAVRDGVAGVPRAYADALIDNSLSLIATVVTAQDLLEAGL